MIELMLFAAKIMPEEEIVKELKKGIEEYEAGNTEEGIKKITLYGMMMGAKQSIGDGPDGFQKIMKAHDKMNKLEKLVDFPES